MKKTLLFTIAAMFAFTPIASAQFVGMGKSLSSKGLGSSESSITKSNSIHASFNPYKLEAKYNGNSMSENYKGFTVGWDHNSILGGTPLILEYGASVDMAFYKDDSSNYYTGSETWLDLRVPCSVEYKLAIPGTIFSIMPLVGLDLGVYLLAQSKTTYKSTSKTETHNLFDNSSYKRFIFDFHVGAKIIMNDGLFFEYRYEGPFVPVYKEDSAKVFFKRHIIGLGYYF